MQPTSRPSTLPSSEPSGEPTGQPSSQPSNVPSTQPTSRPSSQPSSQPSGRPSAHPSTVPTQMPSSVPTQVPITSSPTQEGDTTPPTSRPTSFPTMNIGNYLSFQHYQNFLIQKEAVLADEDAIYHTNYFYKETDIEGTCQVWEDFLKVGLVIPVPGVHFSEISVYGAYTETSGDGSAPIISGDVNCKDYKIVGKIVDALNEGLSEDWYAFDFIFLFEYINCLRMKKKSFLIVCVMYLLHSIRMCDGHKWRIGACSTGPAFCVDCDKVCNACAGDSFLNNPCRPGCRWQRASSLIVKWHIAEDILYPEFMPVERDGPLMKIVTDTYNATVTFMVTVPGTVYCGARPNGTDIISSFDIIDDGNSLVINSVNNNTYYSISVNDLYADTLYDFYCTTQDFVGNTMSLYHTLQTRTNTSTACCREIHLLKVDRIRQYNEEATPVLYSFTLNAIPLEKVRIRLSSYGCPNVDQPGVKFPRFVPMDFEFSPSSVSLTGEFLINAHDHGCFYVKARSLEKTYEEDLWRVIVEPDNSPPAPPVLDSASFSDDGQSVNIYFDTSTNLGGQSYDFFLCSLVFEFLGASTSSCLWKDERSVRVTPIEGYVSNLTIEGSEEEYLHSSITLKPQVVAAACPIDANYSCSEGDFTAEKTVSIQAPKFPIAPFIAMSAPAVVGRCADIVLDLSGSYGSGGRKWKRIEWSVLRNGQPLAYNETGISDSLYNISLGLSTNDLFIVPNEYLVGGATYDFEVTIENFLGMTTLLPKSISVSQVPGVPEVTIAGSSVLFVRRNQQVQLNVIATMPDCANEDPKFAYRWKVFEGFTYMPAIVSTSVNPRYFRLDPYTLDVLNTYTIIVEVSQTVNGVLGESAESFVTVSVIDSGVHAEIAGGADRAVSASEELVLDASSSHSIDYPHDTNLDYVWTCLEVVPQYGKECSRFAKPTNSPFFKMAPGVMGGKEEKKYLFTVTVSSRGKEATAITYITVSTFNIPTIMLGTIAEKFNAQKKITITSNIEASHGEAVSSWSSTSIDDETLMTYISSPVSLPPFTIPTKHPLVIKPNSLTPGQVYLFEMRASYVVGGDSAASVATVQIVVNKPPENGKLEVEPSEGLAMNTTFSMRTYGWLDDPTDYPLTYIMSYYLQSPEDEVIIRAASENPRAKAKLAQGFQTMEYRVFVVVKASDIYEGMVQAVVPVVVNPMQDFSQVDNMLGDAIESGDPEVINQIVGAVIVSVNTVDCTLADKCAIYNRQECSTVPQTCGECLPGFVGTPGHANALCLNLAFRRRRLIEYGEIDDLCRLNEECVSGYCYRGRCKETYKSCPNECTYNAFLADFQGSCHFYDVNNVEISSCGLGDEFCRARCVCNKGYYGIDCGFDATTPDGIARWEEYKALRETSCDTLATTINLQDLSINNMKSWANQISSIFTDPTQITTRALDSCTGVLNTLVTRSPSIAGDTEVIYYVMYAYSALIGMGYNGTEDKLDLLMAGISTLAQGHQDVALTVGENPTTITTTNVRLAIGKVDSRSQTLETPISIPRTFEEYLQAATPLSAAFKQPDSATTSQDVGLIALSFNINPRSFHITSPIFQYEVNYGEEDPIFVKTSMYLKNIEPVPYYTTENVTGVVRCNVADAPYEEVIVCDGVPDGNLQKVNRTVICEGKIRSMLHYQCPIITRYPTCAIYNSQSMTFADTDLCTVIDYSANHSVCECTLPGNNAARKMLANPNGEIFHLLSSEDAVLHGEYKASSQIVQTNFLLEVQDNTIPLMKISPLFISVITIFVLVVFSGFFIAFFGDNDFVKKTLGFRGTKSGTLKKGRSDAEKRYREIELELKDYGDRMSSIDKKDLNMEMDKLREIITGEKKGEPPPPIFDLVMPTEFKEIPWYERYWKCLVANHELFNFFFGQDDEESLAFQWLKIMSQVISVAFIVTLFAQLYFYDDGMCQAIDNMEECVEHVFDISRIGDKVCLWDAYHEYCYLKEPDIDIKNLITFSMFVVTFAYVINQIISKLITKLQSLSFRAKDQVAVHISFGEEPKDDSKLEDEFSTQLSLPYKMMLGARLNVIQADMDFVNAEIELRRLVKKLRLGMRIPLNYQPVDYSRCYERIEREYYKSELYWRAGTIDEKKREKVVKRLIDVRHKSKLLTFALSQYKEKESVWNFEAVLIQHFIVEYLKGARQKAGRFYLLWKEKFGKFDRKYNSGGIIPLISGLSALAFLGGMGLYVMVAGFLMGDKSVTLWFVGIIASVYLIFGILQPILIVWMHIVIPSFIEGDVKTIYYGLKNRVKFILNRTSGLMKTSNAMIQHFNPVCRSVRAFPEYSIARLLLTLNDFDIPHEPAWETRNLFNKTVNAYQAIVYDKPDPTYGMEINYSRVILEIFWYPFSILLEHFVSNIPVMMFEFVMNMILLLTLNSCVLVLCLYGGDAGVITSSVILGIPGFGLIVYFGYNFSVAIYNLYMEKFHPPPPPEYDDGRVKRPKVKGKLDDKLHKPTKIKPGVIGSILRRSKGQKQTDMLMDYNSDEDEEQDDDNGSIFSRSTLTKADVPRLSFENIPNTKDFAKRQDIERLERPRTSEHSLDRVSSLGSMTLSKLSKASSGSKYKISLNRTHKHTIKKHHVSSGSDISDEDTSVLTMNTMNTMETSSSHASLTKAKSMHMQQQLGHIAEVSKEVDDCVPETSSDDMDMPQSLMPLAKIAGKIEPEEYGKFAVPRKMRRRGVLSIGPGLETRQKFLPLEKNIHRSSYLMDLVNLKPEDELPELDVLGQYLGFYDNSGRYRGCPIKYCSGPADHEVHLQNDVRTRGMGPVEEHGKEAPVEDPDHLHKIHHDADVVIKSKFPLWF